MDRFQTEKERKTFVSYSPQVFTNNFENLTTKEVIIIMPSQ